MAPDEKENTSSLLSSNVQLFARIGSALTLILVFVGSVFGRTLVKQYSAAITLAPYVAFCLLIGAVLVTIRLVFGLLGNRTIAIRRNSLLKVLSITILATVVISATCEGLIVHPVERIHFIKYGTLAFFFYFSQKKRTQNRKLIIAFLLSSIIGCSEETLQYFVPDRFLDLRDIALNIAASLFGAIYAWIIVRWKRLLLDSQELPADA